MADRNARALHDIAPQKGAGDQKGKVVLITGCSSGIGYDAAHGLRARGWRVFASCRNPDDCARLIAEGFESPQLDVDDSASIARALSEVLAATGGRLDALYNNAGYGLPALVEDLPRQALRDMFETNLFGPHELTRQVIPVMRAQGHGRIVWCSSVLGLVGYRWRGAYGATKFAMEGLVDILRLELENDPIHVSLIEPGPVTSDFRIKSQKRFENGIDWQSSARRADYAPIIDRLYNKTGKDPFELPASSVTKAVIHALESPRPRRRYFVTVPTWIAVICRRILPVWMIDRIMLRL